MCPRGQARVDRDPAGVRPRSPREFDRLAIVHLHAHAGGVLRDECDVDRPYLRQRVWGQAVVGDRRRKFRRRDRAYGRVPLEVVVVGKMLDDPALCAHRRLRAPRRGHHDEQGDRTCRPLRSKSEAARAVRGPAATVDRTQARDYVTERQEIRLLCLAQNRA